MKRRIPLEHRMVPLLRKVELTRTGGLSPLSAKKWRELYEYRKVRRWVAGRSGHLCEVQVSDVCDVTGSQAHHLLPRSAGGDDTPGNLLWLCAACHRYIHAHPAWSYSTGLLQRRTA